jgi:hypothetical protein
MRSCAADAELSACSLRATRTLELLTTWFARVTESRRGSRMSTRRAAVSPGGPTGVRPEQGLVAQLLTWFSLANFLRNWDYRPVTRWFEHFITINWNAGDADIERHVLGEVGSYGRQLSHVLDAVDLLVGRLDLTSAVHDHARGRRSIAPGELPALMAHLSALRALRHLGERDSSCQGSCQAGAENRPPWTQSAQVAVDLPADCPGSTDCRSRERPGLR